MGSGEEQKKQRFGESCGELRDYGNRGSGDFLVNAVLGVLFVIYSTLVSL
jgi:hypothetical protein